MIPPGTSLDDFVGNIFVHKARFVGAGTIAAASLWAMLGAAETLSYAAATGEITARQAESELFEIILAMVARNVS